MRKIFILFLFIFIFCGICLGQNNISSNDLKSKIEAIEKETNTYWGDNIPLETRLKNAEVYVFGESKKGDMKERITAIYKTLGIPLNEEVPDNPKYEIENNIAANYPSVDKLEKQYFGKTFDKENIYARLDRLEKKVLGKTSQKPLNDRVAALQEKNLKSEKITLQEEKTPTYRQNSYDYNYYSPKTSNSTINSIEKKIWKQSFENELMDKRLSRIENKLFGKDFSDDSESTRIERIKSVVKAAKSGQEYKVNKFAKYAATGIQVGGLILLILAMIL